MLAEIIGSKAFDFSVIEETLALTLVTCLLCKRGWWYCLHFIPFCLCASFPSIAGNYLVVSPSFFQTAETGVVFLREVDAFFRI